MKGTNNYMKKTFNHSIYKEFHEQTKLWENIPWIPREFKTNIENKQYKFDNTVDIKASLDESSTILNAIYNRRTIREYGNEYIEFNDICNLIYYSILHTNKSNLRAYPSAGARYPIELYIIIFNNDILEEGIYHINQECRQLSLIKRGNYREKLYKYVQNQENAYQCSFMIVFTSIFDRTIEKYGDRGYRYILLDAGHLAQNLYILSSFLNIGCTAIGGFYDNKINKLLDLNRDEESIYIMTFGKFK